MFNGQYLLEAKSITVSKLLKMISISAPLSLVLHFVETYIYSDWNFLVSLCVLISVDTFLGIFKSIKEGKVSSVGFGMVVVKVLLYATVLITVHVLTTYTVAGVHPVILDYIDDFVMTSLLVREAISIFESIAVINPEIVPKFILKKLKDFDSDTGKKLNNDEQP